MDFQHEEGEIIKQPAYGSSFAKLFAGLLIEDFKNVRRNVYILQAIGFVSVIILSWWNEIGDLPSKLFASAPQTPANYLESVLETFWMLFLLVIIWLITQIMFSQIRYLEGFLPVCSCCKKIRTNEGWIPLEQYLRERSAIQLTHSLCTACAKEQYKYDEATDSFSE